MNRLTPTAILVAVVLGQAAWTAEARGQSTTAATRTDSIEVYRRFFGGLKYTAGSRNGNVVDPILGMGLSSSFVAVLSSDPEALTEAKKATPYLVAGGASAIAALVGSMVGLVAVLDDAGQGGSDEGVLSGPFKFAIGATIVSVISAFAGGSHIRRAVDTFNAKLQRPSSDEPSSAGRVLPLLGVSRTAGGARLRAGVSIHLR